MAATFHSATDTGVSGLRAGLRQSRAPLVAALLAGGVAAWVGIFTASTLADRAAVIAGVWAMLALLLPAVHAGTIVVHTDTRPETLREPVAGMIAGIVATIVSVLGGSVAFFVLALLNLNLVDPAPPDAVQSALLGAAGWPALAVMGTVTLATAIAISRWAWFETTAPRSRHR